MPILDAQNLTKRLGTRTLFEGVHLTIRRNERVGVVGDNGSGKSTLGKVLAGVLEADLGTLHTRREARIEYLPQNPILDPGSRAVDVVLRGHEQWWANRNSYLQASESLGETPTAEQLRAHALAEQAFEQTGGHQKAFEAERYLKSLGLLDFEADVGPMSGGEKRRVALARLLFADPDLAILDEPTNHLDAESIEWLERHLIERYQGAVVLITHDRFLLNSVVSRTIEIEAGAVYAYNGGWESYLEQKEVRRLEQSRTEANRQNFLRTELEWLRRQPKARTGKQKARIARAEVALSATPERQNNKLTFELERERLGATVLETRGLSVEVGGRTLIEGLDFHLQKGMRLGILGPSGSGKTSLIRTLLGELPPGAGEVLRGTTLKVAYLSQLREGLSEDETVLEAITQGRPSLTIGSREVSAYSYLERFRFRGDSARQKVSGLSGGERARVALARLLTVPANVFVLDEPTNDLDVMTLGALEDLLLDFSGAVLFVSHDRYFVDRVATHVLALDDGRAELLGGGFSSYFERKQRLSEGRAPRVTASAPLEADELASRPSSSARKLTYGEELELKGLFENIEAQTRRVQELEAALHDPSLFQERPTEFVRLESLHTEARQALTSLEDRWLELEERRAAFERKG